MENKQQNLDRENFITENDKEELKMENITEEIKISKENIEDFILPTTLEDYKEISKHFYAGFWIRLIAYIIDIAVTYAITGLINTLTFNKLNITMNIPLLGESSLTFVFVMLFYFVIMTYLINQTLGKIIMGLKVAVISPKKLTLIDVLYREIVGRLLNMALFSLPYLVVAFNSKKMGLHDYIADTVVIKEDFMKLRTNMNKKIEQLNIR